MTIFPSLVRGASPNGEDRYFLGDPLVDRYLEFVAGRVRRRLPSATRSRWPLAMPANGWPFTRVQIPPSVSSSRPLSTNSSTSLNGCAIAASTIIDHRGWRHLALDERAARATADLMIAMYATSPDDA